MRKTILCLLTAAMLFMSGCSAKKEGSAVSQEKMQLYTAYYKSINEIDKFQSRSDYYNIEVVMNQLPGGTYRYYVILDDPQLAMVDVQMLVCDESVDYLNSEMIAPSVGLWEGENYSLIPYQVYPEQGYVKGLMASGETDSPTVTLDIMVLWKDYAKLKETREYLQLTGDFNTQATDEQLKQETEQESEPEEELHDTIPDEEESGENDDETE